MAKLSFYKTIDRSQLGGKFVPLIKSGVSNYKILASDLGKEYHPGDAIEITDTGEINVKFRPDDFDVSSGSLTIKTDESRGVFKGSNGIYIASANDSIGISRDGIKVNPEAFAGSGLSYHKHRLSVNAKAPLSADDNGLSLLIGGAGLEIVSGCLYLDSSVVSHTAADAVYYYMSTRTGSSLSIDQDYLVVNTNYIASAGLTTGLGNYNPISVDVKYVANAIGNNYIGSGLYWDNNNYTLSANVNTATGIIVQDNRLYLNAGAGLHTTNNTVKVKAADSTIGVSSSGIKVNTSALYIPSAYSLAGFGLDVHYDGSLVVKSADGSIFVNGSGIGVDLREAMYVGSGLTNSIGELAVKASDSTISVSRGGISVNTSALSHSIDGSGLQVVESQLCVKPADESIYVDHAGIKVNAGDGLETNVYGLSAKSANNSIGVSEAGITVNAHSLAGYGLSAFSNGTVLHVQPADNTITVGPGGIKVNKSALSIPTASSLAGIGLGLHFDESQLQVKPSDGSIGVSTGGIKVNAGYGLSATSDGLYVNPADNTINASSEGIKVNAGYGLSATSSGLYVKSANATINVSSDGISVPIRSDGGILAGGSGLYLDAGVISGWLAGDGLENKYNILYVKSADNTIGVSSAGIKVNVQSGGGILSGEQGLYFDSSIINIPSVHSYAGDGLYGSGGRLYVKSADDTIYVSSAGIKVNTLEPLVGLGLEWSGAQALYVKSADNTIDVSEAGIKVNPAALAHTLPGKGLYSDNGKISIHVDTAGLGITDSGSIYWKKPDPGWGLESGERGTYYVRSADNTIDVTEGGIKVNAGYGLSAVHNGLYVKSADGSIGVSTDGVYVKAGEGLETTPIGLSVKSADGSIFVDGSGIGVDLRKAKYVGSGLTNSTGELAVKAADNTINVSSAGISVHKSVLSIPDAHSLAGLGLLPNSEGKLAINYGHGLETKYSGLYVKSADDTIDVSSYGIKVNSSALAGHGLRIVDHSILYVKSADNTIVVSHAGIKVSGYGLSAMDYGLAVKAADGTIGVASSGIGVNVISGGGLLTGNDGLYIDSGQLAGNGLAYYSEQNNVKLYVKSADNTIDVSSAGIKVNASALSIPTTSSLAGQGLRSNASGKLDVYYGSGLDIDKSLGKVIVKSADNSIDVTEGGIKVNTSALSLPPSLSAGHGLQLVDGSSLYVQSADGTIGVTSSGIGVNVTSGGGLLTGANGLYINSAQLAGSGLEASHMEQNNVRLGVKSADNTIDVTDAGVKVNTGSVAAAILGHGLEYNSGKLNVYYGSGLAIDAESGKLYVTSSSTPDIGKGLWLASDNNDLLSVYAGSGLGFSQYDNSLEVKTADNSLVVGINGLYIDQGNGLSRDESGVLCIKSKDGSIVPTWEGLAVDIRNAAYIGAGLSKVSGDLEVKNADNSISVTSDGIKVNVGYGLGIDENGGLARLVSHSTDGANWYKKYQDGWIEQGGYFSSNSQEATVTLNTAFANTNYTLMVTCRTAGSSPNYNPAVSAKTTTSFTYNSMIAKAFGAEYYACGY